MNMIKKRREVLGMTQADLAEITGLSQQTISKIENGKIANSGFIVEIAKCLSLDPFRLKLKKEGTPQ